jgi:putative flippase GtrA
MTEAAPPVAGPAATGWRGRLSRWQQIIRYYQAGIVNLAFGYGLYAALVALGVAAYPAQAIAHVLGMGFNYVSYSRHVFREAGPAKLRFVGSYAVNYALSVATLAGLKQVIANDYLAGFLAAVIVSAINYVALKYLVFNRTAA